MSLDCNDLKPERLLVLEGVGSTDLKRCSRLQESYYSDFTIIVSATMEERLSVPRCDAKQTGFMLRSRRGRKTGCPNGSAISVSRRARLPLWENER